MLLSRKEASIAIRHLQKNVAHLEAHIEERVTEALVNQSEAMSQMIEKMMYKVEQLLTPAQLQEVIDHMEGKPETVESEPRETTN